MRAAAGESFDLDRISQDYIMVTAEPEYLGEDPVNFDKLGEANDKS